MQIEGHGVVEYWSNGVMGKNAQGQSLSAKLTADKPATIIADKPSGPVAGSPAGHMAGFTLIELLVAIALGMVILAGLFRTFKVQQDSYVIQDQVSAMQQNLRAAMYMITRDLQMAGYYTNFDRTNRQLDWNDLDGDSNPANNMETGRPLIFAVNNIGSGVGIQEGTDVITIVKADYDPEDPKCGPASTVCRGLGSIGGSASDGAISLRSWDLGGSNFGLLVKEDLSFADLIQKDSGGWKPVGTLMENYGSQDTVYRMDIIIYRVRADAAHPCLERKNLGRGETTYQTIAENIDNLKFRYQLNDGTWVNDPAGNQTRVRAVEVLLVARTAFTQRGYRDTSSITFGGTPIRAPNDSYRRKTLNSIVKTRNVGL
jgi:prepilin-type N-terminal cleavage/methylation domain-containing protein